MMFNFSVQYGKHEQNENYARRMPFKSWFQRMESWGYISDISLQHFSQDLFKFDRAIKTDQKRSLKGAVDVCLLVEVGQGASLVQVCRTA